MVDLSKHKDKTRKTKTRFGDAPRESESTNNLGAPEVAPVDSLVTKKARKKTGRSIPFSTRVSPEFDEDFRQVAFTLRLKHVDLLEQALSSFKSEKGLK